MGLIRFIIVTICVLYIIRYVSRILLPILLQSFIKKAQNSYQQQGKTNPKDGKIRVDYVPPQKKESKLSHKEEGEFIDYEEVK